MIPWEIIITALVTLWLATTGGLIKIGLLIFAMLKDLREKLDLKVNAADCEKKQVTCREMWCQAMRTKVQDLESEDKAIWDFARAHSHTGLPEGSKVVR